MMNTTSNYKFLVIKRFTNGQWYFETFDNYEDAEAVRKFIKGDLIITDGKEKAKA